MAFVELLYTSLNHSTEILHISSNWVGTERVFSPRQQVWGQLSSAGVGTAQVCKITCVSMRSCMCLCTWVSIPSRACVWMCTSSRISAIRGERGRTCWPSPISHAPCFLLHPPRTARGLAGGHPTRPILSPLCISPCPSQLCHLSVWAVWTGKPSASCLQQQADLSHCQCVRVCVHVRVCLCGRGRGGCEKGEVRLKVIQMDHKTEVWN